MDPNDPDIAYILKLREVAPWDQHSTLDKGDVDAVALTDELKDLIGSLAPHVRFVERDGRWTIPASEWAAAYDATTSKLAERMRMRSLEMAANGPAAKMLQGAPCLKHWLPVKDGGDRAAALVGLVHDHPILSTCWLRTTRLCGIDPGGKWARTNSRWYRLDEPSTLEHIAKQLGDRGRAVSGVALSLEEALARTRHAQATEGFHGYL